jgi:RNA recognition motif-containing protein
MTVRVFVGNLSERATPEGVEELFAMAGTVVSVSMPVDRETKRTRGFAYVEMATAAEAEGAVERLDGYEFGGRVLRVSLAQRGDSR